MRKIFLKNTAWAWHDELGQLIMTRAMTYSVDYRLMHYDAHLMCPRASNAHYSMIRLDNAKSNLNVINMDIVGHQWEFVVHFIYQNQMKMELFY
jgi:hypothetical protein